MADYDMDGVEANSSRVRNLVNRAKKHGGFVWFLPDEPKTVFYSIDSEAFDEYPGWDFVDAGVVKIIYKNIKVQENNNMDLNLTDRSLLDAVVNVLSGTHTQQDVDAIQANGEKIDEGGADTEYEKFFMKCLKKFGVDEPDKLPADKKKEFFDYVDKNWKAKDEKKEGRSAKMTKTGRVDGRSKAYRETVNRLRQKRMAKLGE